MSQIANIGLYAIPAFLLLMVVEFIAHYRDRDGSYSGVDTRDTVTSLSIYALGRVAKSFDKFIELPLVLIAAALAPVALSASQWWVWVAAIVLADFAYYFKHRMEHRIRLFWASHSVHHSSQYFNFSTALRLPWLIPGSFITSAVYIPLALIGIPAWMIFLSQAIVLLYQFPIHTERVGRLHPLIEYVFNTPSHHRVHHGANNSYLDKNYGGIFIIWDRMFGSYAEETEPVRFGLTKNIDTHNPIKANYYEFARMISDIRHAETCRGRVGYLLRPPGWTEFGNSATGDAPAGGNPADTASDATTANDRTRRSPAPALTGPGS
ncbi:sterol desaturase family protein [Nocardia flavorosea]|uniref:Sterol desaturase family protein n=2 Tax=Nocardia flavorosea TaxID=53429 RepID=A0A846YMF5_9NOCA|nr:sterol desaturase family protein [Nocardia flavorosea]NKY58438.1 sterol desaturase family protein [Nocardia flavorosea]